MKNTSERIRPTAAVALVAIAVCGWLTACASPTWKVVKPADPPYGCEELRKRTGDDKAC